MGVVQFSSVLEYAERKRKAVSPLIATVILVAITVTIGTILTATFTNVFRGQAGQIEEQVEARCDFVALNARNPIYDGSVTPPRLTFDLENTRSASIRITGVRISYTDKNSTTAVFAPQTLGGNDRLPIVIDATEAGDVRPNIEFVRVLNPCQTLEIIGAQITGATP